MSTHTEFALESGATVIVESPGPSGVGPAGHIDEAAKRAGRTLRESLGSVVEAAADMMDAFQTLPRKPKEVEIEFGVELDTTLNAIIASTSGKAHLQVTVRWSPAEND